MKHRILFLYLNCFVITLGAMDWFPFIKKQNSSKKDQMIKQKVRQQEDEFFVPENQRSQKNFHKKK